MLKFEGIAIGTTIKAYDFGIDDYFEDRYVSGPIIDTTVRDGAKVYVINCRVDTSFPEGRGRVGLLVYVPMETVLDFDGRVTPLDGPCA